MMAMLCSAARMSSKWQSVNHTSRAVGDKAVRISIAVQFPPQTHFSHSNRPWASRGRRERSACYISIYLYSAHSIFFVCIYKSALAQNRFFWPNLGNGNFCVVSTPKSALRKRASAADGWKSPLLLFLKNAPLLCSPFFRITLSVGDAARCLWWEINERAALSLAACVCVRFLLFYIVFQWAALSFLSLGFLIDAVLDNLWHHAEFFGAAREN